MGQHLPGLIPMVVTHCQKAGENNDELKEACLQVSSCNCMPQCLQKRQLQETENPFVTGLNLIVMGLYKLRGEVLPMWD